MKKLILYSFVIGFITSCAFSKATMIDAKHTYTTIPLDSVKIFLDERDLPIKYEKIAVISTSFSQNYDNAKWKSVKNKCAEIGANGVYQKSIQRASTADKIAGAVFGYSTMDKAEFIAIKY